MSMLKTITRKKVTTQMLFDLSVEDDESYIANGMIVHNCKSRLEVNEKGAEGNPEIKGGGTPLSQKALDSITLCEANYSLGFQLVEPKARV